MKSHLWLHVFSLLVVYYEVHAADDACPTNKDFDYIVVGAGATGSVVINRLSEDPNIKVLALEAGGHPNPVSEIPLLAFKEFHTSMDWNYTTESQDSCCNIFTSSKLQYTRGKALGGTASLNFMTYTRGNKRDYDLWKELGNEGWGWDDLYPIFFNMEDYRCPILNKEDEPYHHGGGMLPVEIPPFKTVLAQSFLDAGVELGFPLVDYNAKDQIGFMYPPVTIKNGSRFNAYHAYLEPAMARTNLQVEMFAMATKILFDNKTATTAIGVEFQKGNTKCTAYASKEVIISAGAINSPQLLMLSGIGPKADLEQFKIPVVKDLPGVGENLQGHVTVGGQMWILNSTVAFNSVRYETPEYEELWEKTRTGPMTVPVSFEGLAYLSTNVTDDPPDWPDIEIFFNSDNTARIFKEYIKWYLRPMIPGAEAEAISFVPILLRPKSRGTVKLQSADPFVHPLIDPKYLSHPDDVKVLGAGVTISRNLAKTAAFQKYGATAMNYGLNYPTCEIYHLFSQTKYDQCIATKMASDGYHPSSTCKMGPSSDPMAVVDNQLRVHGFENLRVADASIMPNIVAGHPQVACMVIGEKLAAMIKDNN